MANFTGILKFKGTWRKYQARVLSRSMKYLSDGKIHIVAAPGSGKTTLGIELIGRMNKNALVLAPSITIREQWVARIEDAFLCEGVDGSNYLSQDIKNPKAITVVTYQSLHSAMTRFKGKEEEEADDVTHDLDVDYSEFNVIETLKAAKVELLCLDECHHLRSEWWKALEDFKKEMGELNVIALTATPPYDSQPAMWKRYMQMCGEIDEEITIPELVKEGSLCAHQDYVYFNYPTKEEEAEIKEYEDRANAMYETLMADEALLTYISSHTGLFDSSYHEKFLENPAYLSSLLIYLKSKNAPYPKTLVALLGAKVLPKMSKKWMQHMLQGFLYEDSASYNCTEDEREQYITLLKSKGLIEKKKVTLETNDATKKMLTTSLGKCNSIRDIVFHEYNAMGSKLRLLVLTDYIRKEYEKAIGNDAENVTSLGVLPFFEMLRRENKALGNGIRFGVLCGTIVIIPATAREMLLKEIEGIGEVNFSSIGSLSEEEYLKVNPIGDSHFLTGAVTAIFSKGAMEVMIGTKSLLGEGWDSPCINSLILASFVGSFMLSNQMRGRAIRVFKEVPDKTSNIWHLVCLNPMGADNLNGQNSEDYELLQRRMEHFMGLHYEDDTIENGIDRMSVIKPPFNKGNVEKINNKMLEISKDRETVARRWRNALSLSDNIEIVDETSMDKKIITAVMFFDALKVALTGTILAIALALALTTLKFNSTLLTNIFKVGIAFCIFKAVIKLPKLIKLRSPLSRLKTYGKAIHSALLDQSLLESEGSKVVTEQTGDTTRHAIYLKGGTSKDKKLFADCVSQFFDPIDNQRYILVREKDYKKADGFFAVPECFCKKKEDAEVFADSIKPYLGKYNLVYTRNEDGRKLLLEGRKYSLANKEERCITKKKVKGALE